MKVKNWDDKNNIPYFKKMIEVKKKFLTKFSYILDTLDADTKNEIVLRNYYELLGNAYLLQDKENLRECKTFLKDNNFYSKIEDLKVCLRFKIKKNYFVKKFRNIFAKKVGNL